MTSRFASLTEQDIEKIVEDKSHKTQKGHILSMLRFVNQGSLICMFTR